MNDDLYALYTRNLVIVSNFEIVENRELNIFIKSLEQPTCPICFEPLQVAGSRNRKVRFSDTEVCVYRIRRLQCNRCGRIHHELPDVLVPYKRYAAEVITAVLESPSEQGINESTIRRMHHWFTDLATSFTSGTFTVRNKYLNMAVVLPPDCTLSKLDRLKFLYNHHPRWLSHLVQTLANMNLWPQTSSAWTSF